MGIGFKHGAGGSNPLNFKVIVNPQPQTAKENTIWVDTDKINNYYFSATQPENMAEYDVWISTGTSSPVSFNALKKNSIQVYPLSVKQYIGGAWVDKAAKSWQGGKWVDWITYLYNMGDECTDITGGWKSLARSGYTYNAKNTAEGLYEKKTSNKGAYPSNWYTNNMIDVTDISVIHAKILATVAIDAWIRIIITRNNADLENEYLAWVNVNYTNANELVQIDLDVSAFSGNYYIKLNHQGGSNAEVFWKEVWFE